MVVGAGDAPLWQYFSRLREKARCGLCRSSHTRIASRARCRRDEPRCDPALRAARLAARPQRTLGCCPRRQDLASLLRRAAGQDRLDTTATLKPNPGYQAVRGHLLERARYQFSETSLSSRGSQCRPLTAPTGYGAISAQVALPKRVRNETKGPGASTPPPPTSACPPNGANRGPKTFPLHAGRSLGTTTGAMMLIADPSGRPPARLARRAGGRSHAPVVAVLVVVWRQTSP
jgi:hypothetical protein